MFFKFSKISNSFRFSNEMWVLSSIYVRNLQGSFITFFFKIKYMCEINQFIRVI